MPRRQVNIAADKVVTTKVFADFLNADAATLKGTIIKNYTVNTTTESPVLTATQLIDGYHYDATTTGAATLTFPGADAVEAELVSRGLTAASGVKLMNVVVENDASFDLVITASTGETIQGDAIINNNVATINYIMTSNVTANIHIILGGTSGGATSDFTTPITTTDSTQATDVDTGSLIVDGGVGIAKDLFLGGSFHATQVVASAPSLGLPYLILIAQANQTIANLDTADLDASFWDLAGDRFQTGGANPPVHIGNGTFQVKEAGLYFLSYQLQWEPAYNFDYGSGINLNRSKINSITSASPAVFTTVGVHGFTTGQSITTKSTDSGDMLNGIYNVIVVTTTTFRISLNGVEQNNTGGAGTTGDVFPTYETGYRQAGLQCIDLVGEDSTSFTNTLLGFTKVPGNVNNSSSAQSTLLSGSCVFYMKDDWRIKATVSQSSGNDLNVQSFGAVFQIIKLC